MEVIFLGTAGSFPTARRNSPAIAVRRGPELLLLDSGEGTQRQITLAKVGLQSRMRILITHMHGDHVLGIPGLLQTMALFNRTSPLLMYGPKGVYAFIKAVKQTVKFGLTFPIEVKEVKSGLVFAERDYYVESVWTKHPVPTLAYAIVEKPRPGRFYPEKAEALGVSRGPLWSALQHGESVEMPTGQIVSPDSLVGPARRGRRVVYSGDTSPCETVLSLAKEANLLIHEATFGDELAEKALGTGPSTPSMAAETAKQAKVHRLTLTHISGRYDEDRDFLEGAKRIFEEVVLAEDFMVLNVPLRD